MTTSWESASVIATHLSRRLGHSRSGLHLGPVRLARVWYVYWGERRTDNLIRAVTLQIDTPLAGSKVKEGKGKTEQVRMKERKKERKERKKGEERKKGKRGMKEREKGKR